jgi:imidazolonepropionase-like amidohydrolase
MRKTIRLLSAVLMFNALSTPETTLIRGARVFDGDQMLGIQNVLIDSGKILRIAPRLAVPRNTHVIYAKDGTLLPGFFDSHQHIDDGRYTLAVAALFAISTVIDLFTGGPGNTPRESHERVHNREPGTSADFLSAGICVTVKGGHGTGYGVTIPTLDDPLEAQTFIDARIAEGSDVIKIIYEDFGGKMPRLPKATMEAAVNAAHARGKLAVVHAGEGPDAIRDSLEAGADGIAHLFVNGVADQAFAQTFVSHGAFLIPTLTELVNLCGLPDNAALGRDWRVAPWLPENEAERLKTSVGKPKRHYDCIGAFAALPTLANAGVPILAGTDAGNPGVSYGASLHEELELLVRCGLSPVQALRSATSVPARIWRMPDRGRIAPSLRADLLLVDGDPSADISTTRNIDRIWLAGVLVGRDSLLVKVKGLPSKIATGSDQPSGFADTVSWKETAHTSLVVHKKAIWSGLVTAISTKSRPRSKSRIIAAILPVQNLKINRLFRISILPPKFSRRHNPPIHTRR